MRWPMNWASPDPVAWVLSYSEITSVLAGAEKPEHVSDNFKGTEIKLPDEAIRQLNAAADSYTALVKDA